jgi:hypothetical protein
MELLELFAKAIAPKLLERIFDNIPQSAILFAVIMFFVIKYLLKWNKARNEELKKREERSDAILRNTNNLIEQVSKIEKDQQETTLKLGKLNDRVLVIETRDKINSKQENAIIGMLNRIINSIDRK